MHQHLSQFMLSRVFSGLADQSEVGKAVPHLAHCVACKDLAASVIGKLKKANLLADFHDARNAILTLLSAEESDALHALCARANWAALKKLSVDELIEHIKSEPSLQTQVMFDIILEQASEIGRRDPLLGEETGLAAYALAFSLPETAFSDLIRNDLKADAMLVVANCRRFSANWRGSASALDAASNYHERGTADPAREARLQSLQASLATDTGHLEEAEMLLARAAAAYRKAADWGGVATIKLQHANTLLTVCRYEEALARAEEALSQLAPHETRLVMLAHYNITECLLFIGRPIDALRSYFAACLVSDKLSESQGELRSGYLEALLLESFGHSREADKTFRIVVAGFVEAKLFKDAFLVMLTRFEILMRREALAKATLVCKEALATLQKTDGLGFPAQLENLWLNLMARAAARRLTAHQIQEARRFLVQQWTASSPIPLPVINDNNAPENSSLVARPSSKAPAVHSDMSGSREFSVERTTPWAHFGLALHQYDRALICVGLAQCGGRVREAARLLGISRNTLRTKIAKYGLSSGTSTFQQPSAGIARPMLLNDEEKDLLLQLRTRAWRRELKSLNTAEQFRRIKAVLFLQTREMFAALIDEASSTSLTNPAAGEKMARVAYALAELISPTRVTPRERNDLRAKGLLVIGNCRRLAGDWRHSIATLNTANRHLDRGTEDPQLRARLLSVQASLASDMGNREKALSLLEHASSIYRRIRDIAGVAFIAVQEANVLLAAYHHENAIAKAEETLTVLTNKEARLAHLARNIIIESLVFLGRPIDALRKVQAERRSHDKFGGQRAELRLAHLEALILDSLGLSQEAESIFRSNVEGFMESGLCKDAFLVLLTRFELLYQRGELDRAARACDDAIKWMEGTKEGRHAEAIRLFRNLLSLMTARALTANHLLRARQVLADSWNGTSTTEDEPTPSQKEASAIIYEESRPVRAPEPPPVPSHLTAGDYEKALEHYERHLITAALARCQGHLSETCRLLGISRNTLKSRMKQYGLPTSNAS